MKHRSLRHLEETVAARLFEEERREVWEWQLSWLKHYQCYQRNVVENEDGGVTINFCEDQ